MGNGLTIKNELLVEVYSLLALFFFSMPFLDEQTLGFTAHPALLML